MISMFCSFSANSKALSIVSQRCEWYCQLASTKWRISSVFLSSSWRSSSLKPTMITCATFGLIFGLNRPGGNLTGLTMMNTSLTAKQIELMHETLPAGAAIAILSDPNTEGQELKSTARQAGQALGRRILIIPTASEDDFETAVTSIASQEKVGLVIPDRPLFVSRHNQLAALVARRAIPAIFPPADLAPPAG